MSNFHDNFPMQDESSDAIRHLIKMADKADEVGRFPSGPTHSAGQLLNISLTYISSPTQQGGGYPREYNMP